jgi:hypothetical protein
MIAWTATDVGIWLTNLELKQYVDIFRKNEITGEVLVDLTLDDLDYLNITVLAHRKTIMKAVEEIRRQLKLNGTLPASGLQRVQVVSTDDLDGDRFVGKSIAEPKSAPVIQPVHWSQLEPISAKAVSHLNISTIRY